MMNYWAKLIARKSLRMLYQNRNNLMHNKEPLERFDAFDPFAGAGGLGRGEPRGEARVGPPVPSAAISWLLAKTKDGVSPTSSPSPQLGERGSGRQFNARFEWARLAQCPISIDGLREAAEGGVGLSMLSDAQRRAAFDALAVPEIAMTLDATDAGGQVVAAIAQALLANSPDGWRSGFFVVCCAQSGSEARGMKERLQKNAPSLAHFIAAQTSGCLSSQLPEREADSKGYFQGRPALLIVERALDMPGSHLDAIFRACDQSRSGVRVLLVDDFSGPRRKPASGDQEAFDEMSAFCGFRRARIEGAQLAGEAAGGANSAPRKAEAGERRAPRQSARL